jgi:hypothetical protein
MTNPKKNSMVKTKSDPARYSTITRASKRATEAPGAIGEANNSTPLHLAIQKGVPMPTGRRDTGELHKILQTMVTGDCVDLPYPRFQRSNVSAIANRAGIKVVTRYLCLHPEASNGQIVFGSS